MTEQSSQSLARDIASNVLKATAVTTARDLQINTLEINFKTMFEQNAREHIELKETLETMTLKFDAMIEKMDNKYAGKWVEKMWVGFFILLGTGVCTYLGALIYKATIHLN